MAEQAEATGLAVSLSDGCMTMSSLQPPKSLESVRSLRSMGDHYWEDEFNDKIDDGVHEWKDVKRALLDEHRSNDGHDAHWEKFEEEKRAVFEAQKSSRPLYPCLFHSHSFCRDMDVDSLQEPQPMTATKSVSPSPTSAKMRLPTTFTANPLTRALTVHSVFHSSTRNDWKRGFMFEPSYCDCSKGTPPINKRAQSAYYLPLKIDNQRVSPRMKELSETKEEDEKVRPTRSGTSYSVLPSWNMLRRRRTF